ncbi:MAG: YdiU family protein [Crocinitomicaceae bacterium]
MTDFNQLHWSPVFSNELPFDPIQGNYTRQVNQVMGSFVKPRIPSHPALVHVSSHFLSELNLTIEDENEFLAVVSGAKPFANYPSFAMNYGGHQFGNWAGQLGDGRAINIGETTIHQQPWTFQLKGAGPTPYSRGSDGLAVLRSSIREYLCSEAMHALGVPTTRALSLAITGDKVTRDILYNGNPAEEKGAIVCRVSPSFIRFGSFEIFTSRNELDQLKELLDYTIVHHYPELGAPSKYTYLKCFAEIAKRTGEMIVHWQRVGFVHGVMNTDNLSILGLTIDYGPYGWLEDYNPDWTPNTTDSSHRRYRFGNQPNIALWNLTQLANTLYPLINEAEPFNQILTDFKNEFEHKYQVMLSAKIGLKTVNKATIELNADLLDLMRKSEMDMTIFYRELSELEMSNPLNHLLKIKNASYLAPNHFDDLEIQWKAWLNRYVDQLNLENWSQSERVTAMNVTNPKYVLRNWMAQLAIDEADKGDYGLIDELYNLLLKPYDNQPEMVKWFAKRPDWAKEKVGCSMLSCSS